MKENKQAAGETVVTMEGEVPVGQGSAGLNTQVGSQPTTVSSVASATGGVGGDNLIQADIDKELFQFKGDDTPVMDIMLKSKKVTVDSCEVDHYMIDEDRSTVTTNAEITVANTTTATSILPLESKDQNLIKAQDTLLVVGVNGYKEDGKTRTPGIPLMLYVTGQDPVTQNPVVRPVNGQKTQPNAEYSCMVTIPNGSEIRILSNALYETQKFVEPDTIVPQANRVYLQKRGMNQVVSDYFQSQKKRIPFQLATIAEAAIRRFKTKGNRTLWAGVKGKFKVKSENKAGMQDVYFTEGLRYQFKRELQHGSTWTFEEFIALAKMFFTGEDVPKTALLLSGKNLLENIQCIDFSKHPEVEVSTVKNETFGWSVTQIHTVFGDIQLKREPTLDRLGWSNSGALVGEDRFVHYQRVAEHSFNESVQGEEAKRSGVLVFDALAMKGSCHIWIDGEGSGTASADAVPFKMWDKGTAPDAAVEGEVYYLLEDCPAINKSAMSGQLWQKTSDSWAEYQGNVYAGK